MCGKLEEIARVPSRFHGDVVIQERKLEEEEQRELKKKLGPSVEVRERRLCFRAGCNEGTVRYPLLLIQTVLFCSLLLCVSVFMYPCGVVWVEMVEKEREKQ